MNLYAMKFFSNAKFEAVPPIPYCIDILGRGMRSLNVLFLKIVHSLTDLKNGGWEKGK